MGGRSGMLSLFWLRYLGEWNAVGLLWTGETISRCSGAGWRDGVWKNSLAISVTRCSQNTERWSSDHRGRNSTGKLTVVIDAVEWAWRRPILPPSNIIIVFNSMGPEYRLKVGWRGKFFLAYQNQCVSKLPESNKSSYWAGDVVKNTVKSRNSQMNFHSVEIFPRDVNCRKRHYSGSTLLHMRACAIGSQSPTSTTLSHFWLLGSKYEHEMGPKTKTNSTYEFTEFSLFLTLSLPRNQSEWY